MTFKQGLTVQMTMMTTMVMVAMEVMEIMAIMAIHMEEETITTMMNTLQAPQVLEGEEERQQPVELERQQLQGEEVEPQPRLELRWILAKEGLQQQTVPQRPFSNSLAEGEGRERQVDQDLDHLELHLQVRRKTRARLQQS